MTHTDRDIDVPLREPPPSMRDEVPGSVAMGVQHADVRDQLSGYLDGSLSAVDQVAVREHLDRCAPCRAFWNTFRRVVEVTRQLPTHTLSHDAKRHLLEQIKGSAAAAPKAVPSAGADER